MSGQRHSPTRTDDAAQRAAIQRACQYITDDSTISSYLCVPIEWVKAEREKLGNHTGEHGRTTSYTEGAPIAGGNAAFNEAAARASGQLLDRCLLYGLRHDRDLGMGTEAFYARVAERGVSL